MSGFWVGLIIVAVYLLMFWGIVRWVRYGLWRRAQAAADALAAQGAKIIAVRPSPAWFKPAEVELVMEGTHAFFRVQRYGRDYVMLTVRIDAPALPAIWIRPENAAERLGKALGMNREVQVGDAAFDAAAFISSNAPDALVLEALASPEVRAAVLRTLELGYQVHMSRDGLCATRLVLGLGAFDASAVPAVLRTLGAMVPGLPQVDAARLVDPPPARGMTPALVAVVLSMVGFGMLMAAAPALPAPVNDTDTIKAMGFGLVPWLLVVFGLTRALRGRPMAFVELIFTAVFSLVGVASLTATALMAYNARADVSPAVTHATRVLYVARRDSEARVEPWDPARTWQKIGMPRAVHRTLKVGDTVEVDVHPGALGWPWVSEVRRVAKP